MIRLTYRAFHDLGHTMREGLRHAGSSMVEVGSLQATRLGRDDLDYDAAEGQQDMDSVDTIPVVALRLTV